jgi:hypothetical protein
MKNNEKEDWRCIGDHFMYELHRIPHFMRILGPKVQNAFRQSMGVLRQQSPVVVCLRHASDGHN